MKIQSAKKPVSRFIDLNTQEAVDLVRELAASYTAKSTVSKQAAFNTLRREGILTPKGNLTKRYSGK